MAAALDSARAHGAAPPLRAVRRLTLSDFRGYARLRLEPDARPVVLAGPNGAGKTNLLEALSLLAPGRGLRRARLADIDRWRGEGPWAVAVRVEGGPFAAEIGTGRDPASERRALRIDGEAVRGSARLAEIVGVVWLTPEMDRLLESGAPGRRRFLDRLVVAADAAHARELARYEHALRERARLLQHGRGDPAWLALLEERVAASGVAVAAARLELVAGLNAALAAASGVFPRPGLAVTGTLEGRLEGQAALAVEEWFRDRLAERRDRDREQGVTGLGPHRSDLVVEDLELGQPAASSSTGRQKALLVSIVLAEARLRAARVGCLPVLLLDEVAAHLDADRRSALFAELVALRAQTWLTGTDSALFRPLAEHAQFFDVQNATVRVHEPDNVFHA